MQKKQLLAIARELRKQSEELLRDAGKRCEKLIAQAEKLEKLAGPQALDGDGGGDGGDGGTGNEGGGGTP